MTDDVAGMDEIRKDKPTINKTPNAGKNMEQQELSFIAGRNAAWCSCFGRQLGNCL